MADEDKASGNCPYYGLPDHAFWHRSVRAPAPGDVDPVVQTPFAITKSDPIATAGSCFAQHIARRLKGAGYSYLVAEAGYPGMAPALQARFNYGTFSARTGNIYTARQLVQLMERAYGRFTPQEPFWREGSHWLDPIRPMIQPLGFETLREAELDRAQHLASVRRMMETLDTFVFTLGLTEGWVCSDGAVLPVCPGCGVGIFDAQKYAFHNFTVEEVIADLRTFIAALRKVNLRSKIILTVSPVPLIATYSGAHVLSATTYSKSVLRVAAETVARSEAACAYFPSYELVTGSFSRGAYFADDLRNVREDGVDHVMRVFFRHFCGEEWTPDSDVPSAAAQAAGPSKPGVLDAVCEEYASLGGAGESP